MAAISPELPGLALPARLWEQMRADVEQRAPEEACGLVAGCTAESAGMHQARTVIPVTNALHSQARYRMDPREQLAAFQQMDDQGWDLLAIYHSHPAGPPHPSATDVAEAYYPEAIYLIWSPQVGKWNCRAFRILNEQILSVRLTQTE